MQVSNVKFELCLVAPQQVAIDDNDDLAYKQLLLALNRVVLKANTDTLVLPGPTPKRMSSFVHDWAELSGISPTQ